MKRIYFDHNASSPLRTKARAVLADWATDVSHGNPSSAHQDGRKARRRLEESRERIAALAGCQAEELVFTSGGTESNAWALAGWERVAVLPVEHPSILRAAERRPQHELLPLDDQHRLDMEAASPFLARCDVASLALANHETGMLQDLSALHARHENRSWLLHTDASQAFGRVPVSFAELGVDLMTLTAHKLGGPTGIGALIIRDGVHKPPLVVGGPQEGSRRAGTECVMLAEMFAAAAEEAVEQQALEHQMWARWTSRLRAELPQLEPDLEILTNAENSLPNTLCIAFPGRQGQTLVHRLDLEGVSLSHGSACASGSLEPSAVLLAMGCRDEVAESSLRVSFGHGHGREDLDVFLDRLAATLKAVQPRSGTQKN